MACLPNELQQLQRATDKMVWTEKKLSSVITVISLKKSQKKVGKKYT